MYRLGEGAAGEGKAASTSSGHMYRLGEDAVAVEGKAASTSSGHMYRLGEGAAGEREVASTSSGHMYRLGEGASVGGEAAPTSSGHMYRLGEGAAVEGKVASTSSGHLYRLGEGVAVGRRRPSPRRLAPRLTPPDRGGAHKKKTLFRRTASLVGSAKVHNLKPSGRSQPFGATAILVFFPVRDSCESVLADRPSLVFSFVLVEDTAV